MNDNTLVILIAAIPPTLVALAAFMQSVKNNNKIDESSVTQHVIVKKTEEIHDLTNRNFSEQKQEIAILRAEIEVLKKAGVTIDVTRAQLASETSQALHVSEGSHIIKP